MTTFKFEQAISFTANDRPEGQNFDKDFDILFKTSVASHLETLVLSITGIAAKINFVPTEHNFRTTNKGVQKFMIEAKIVEENQVTSTVACHIFDSFGHKHTLIDNFTDVRTRPLWIHPPVFINEVEKVVSTPVAKSKESSEGFMKTLFNQSAQTNEENKTQKNTNFKEISEQHESEAKNPELEKQNPLSTILMPEVPDTVAESVVNTEVKTEPVSVKESVPEVTTPAPLSNSDRLSAVNAEIKEISDICEDIATRISRISNNNATVSAAINVPLLIVSGIRNLNPGSLTKIELEEISKKVDEALADIKNGKLVTKTGGSEFTGKQIQVNEPIKEKESSRFVRLRALASQVESLIFSNNNFSSIHDAVKEVGISYTVVTALRKSRFDEIREDDAIAVLTKLRAYLKKENDKKAAGPTDVEKRIELGMKLKAIVSQYSDMSQSAVARLLGISQTYISIIARGKYEAATVSKWQELLACAEKAHAKIREAEAKKLSDEAAKIAAERDRAKEEMAKEAAEDKDLMKKSAELHAQIVASGFSNNQLAQMLAVSPTVINTVVRRMGHELGDAMLDHLKESLDILEDKKVSKVTSLSDLAKLQLNADAVHPATGVRFPKYTSNYADKARSEIKNRYDGNERNITRKVSILCFNSNSQRLRILSKNAMEIANMTGIHYNVLKNAMNFAKQPNSVEQMAIYLYLADIEPQLEEIKKKMAEYA